MEEVTQAQLAAVAVVVDLLLHLILLCKKV
jgi:hypothetical protein